jgi:hypothetical protein
MKWFIHCIPLPPIVGKPAIAEFVAGFAVIPAGRLEIHNRLLPQHRDE